MAVYVVAQSKVKNAELLASYAAEAGPTIMKHGARVIAVDETPQVIEGDGEPLRTVILEFESEEAFRSWYDSPEYQAAMPKRLEAAPGTLSLVKGLG